MTDKIFQEIEEEARIERIRKLSKKMLPAVGLLVVLISAGVGGWQYHSWQKYRSSTEDSTEYFKAMDWMDKGDSLSEKPGLAEKQQEALRVFAMLGKKASGDIKGLSLLNMAVLEVKAGQVQNAQKVWKDVAADHKIDRLLGGLADFLQIQYIFNTASVADVQKKINELRTRPGGWAAYADEFEALLDLREKKVADAKKILAELMQNPTASPGIRGRAGSLLQTLSASTQDITK